MLRELDRAGVIELRPSDAGDLVPAGDDSDDALAAVPGLLVVRFAAPLYTANVRSVNRKVVAAVDARVERDRVTAGSTPLRVLVLDTTVVGEISFTVLRQLPELERELAERDIILWLAGLSPRVLEVAQRLPRWDEFAADGRLFPTASAAVRAYSPGALTPVLLDEPDLRLLELRFGELVTVA